MNIIHNLKRLSLIGAMLTSMAGMTLATSTAFAIDYTYGASQTTKTTAASTSTNDQQHLQTIISKGNQEITRRLASLNEALTKIQAATKLSASDKTYLVNEINTEITGLTTLKTKLDGETTLASAITDAKSIFSDYRVYALVLPKAWLVRFADGEQVTEDKLSTLAQKLQTRLNAAKTSGKNVTTLQSDITDMTTQIAAAKAISTSIESKVLTLQPSDYNSDHTVLSGDIAQLKTAHTDIQTAIADAKNVVAGLKNL